MGRLVKGSERGVRSPLHRATGAEELLDYILDCLCSCLRGYHKLPTFDDPEKLFVDGIVTLSKLIRYAGKPFSIRFSLGCKLSVIYLFRNLLFG